MQQPPQTDPLTKCILRCVVALMLVDKSHHEVINTSSQVRQFLHDPTCKKLQIKHSHKAHKLSCYVDQGLQPCSEPTEDAIYFVKTSSAELKPNTFTNQVLVTSTRGSPLTAFLEMVSEVYQPLLLKDPNMNEELKGLVATLQRGLTTAVHGYFYSSSDGKVRYFQQLQFDPDNTHGILTVLDEYRFWETLARDAPVVLGGGPSAIEVQKKAIAMQKFLQPLSEKFEKLKTLDINEVSGLIGDTIKTLNDIVESHHPANLLTPHRTLHFIYLVTQSLCSRIQHQFESIDMWTSNFSDIRSRLNEWIKRICRNWLDNIGDWKRSNGVSQKKDTSTLALESLMSRLTNVYRMRAKYDELLRLLPPEVQEKVQLQSLFEPLKRAPALLVNEFARKQWEIAEAKYESSLEGIKVDICTQLRKEIFAESQKRSACQLLRELDRWKGLLSMKGFKEELVNERQQILSKLTAYLASVRDEFERKSSSQERIAGIQWAKQLSALIRNNHSLAQTMLSDLPRFQSDYMEQEQHLIANIDEYLNQQFRSWEQNVQSKMQSGVLVLRMDKQLMQLDQVSGFFRVNFSDELVTLVQDVRSLKELGFRIRKPVMELSEQAKKMYKEGLALKQIANFYNSMSSQIIPSQKKMLLASALKFEKAVKAKSGQDPAEVEMYIANVQKAAQGLMVEIRQLRKLHSNLTEEVIELMSTDLLRSRKVWDEKVNSMNRVMGGRSNAQFWRKHWDRQLFKALDFQYKLGLQSLSENLQQIRAELVYMTGSRTLGFKPSLPELKDKYYKEIQSFVSFPLQFKGVDGGENAFHYLVAKNKEHITTVYKKAENLFSKLQDLLGSLSVWVAIGSIDVEAFFSKQGGAQLKPELWEQNVAILRDKRRELHKLPDVYRVECFAISSTAFKEQVDDLIGRVLEEIVKVLRVSIKQESDEVREFMDAANKALTAKPTSMEEIEEANREMVKLAERRQDVHSMIKACEQKETILRRISGEDARVALLQSQWDNFEINFASYEEKIAAQKDRLRKEANAKIHSLSQQIDKFYRRWTAHKPKASVDAPMTKQEAQEYAQQMKEWRQDWEGLHSQVESMLKSCSDLGVEVPSFAFYQDIKLQLHSQQESWKLYEEFEAETAQLGEEFWGSFAKEVGKIQDLLMNWSEKLKGRQRDVVTKYLRHQLELLQASWPLLKLLSAQEFETDHWKSLYSFLSLEKGLAVKQLKVQHFLDHLQQLVKHATDVKELCARAQGQVAIREAIAELDAWCEDTVFHLIQHQNAEGQVTPLIKEWKDLITEVSDNQALLISLKESRYFPRFADRIEKFQEKLMGVDDYLQKLNTIQRKWVYLEPIFGRGALPSQQGRFQRVNDEYRQIMLDIGANPKVLQLCTVPALSETLDTIIDQLERCQKALNDYLEEKRSKFPRFYFIGDDDLLQILGQSKNPQVIQTHLKKLFAGIHKVEFDESCSKIIAMLSQAGEEVTLLSPVELDENVENWLGQLAQMMKQTLLKRLSKATRQQTDLDLGNEASQVVCVSELVLFNAQAVAAMQKNALTSLKQKLAQKLEQYTGIKGEGLVLLQLKALILDLIHNMEVVDLLIQERISDPKDWAWHKQIKFELRRDQQCIVSMCKAVFDYTYEYQGNAPKLVHTPLTDKCYLTLTQGMKLGYGGNPYGPAGTGKTESVKALGQAMGRQVLVFNCDEGIDFQSMGRIFIGLVKCGAWGCFDEFNRLLEEQLSAISQQIQVIQWALKQALPVVELLGRKVDVNKNAGIFVTMNPAAKGYGGRSKLPDNLKQLFRPVAMSAPDNMLIAKVLLFAEGFKFADKFAQKIVELFKMSKELLSAQQHYDWGLRALKTVLTVGGQLIQNQKTAGRVLDQDAEAVLLIKAVRINTLSKLTYADCQKFLALLSNMFPGVQAHDILYADLKGAIEQALKELKLLEVKSQIDKMLQFHEATRQRMGVVIVGPSGCGKSTILRVLKRAYEKLNSPLVEYFMNPKSMPRTQLLGYMDHDTREWFDGVLTRAARSVIKEPLTTRSWIICDGDIDPKWIESLNSVLDDNHLLTLPNGERISFADNVNFIFQTHSLKYASPATVSRMGMIFLSDQDVDHHRLLLAWLNHQPEQMRAKLEVWIEEIFTIALQWVLDRFEHVIVQTTKVGLVNNALSQLPNEVTSKTLFTNAVLKGLGANLPVDLRKQFFTEMYRRNGENLPDPAHVLEHYFDHQKGSLRSFDDRHATIKGKPQDLFQDATKPPLVMTVEAQRDIDLVRAWVIGAQPFILVGPEGCGKSMLIRRLVTTQLKGAHYATIDCSAQTTAKQVLQKLNQLCIQSSAKNGRLYRPKECQRLILYLKDINLPKPDEYETIQLIAFLQQIVAYDGFYDDNLDFVTLERIQIIASMNPSSTLGRYQLSTRFTAMVRIAFVDYPTAESLQAIYTQYLSLIIPQNSQLSPKRVAAFMIQTLMEVRQRFPVATYRHYLFTPRQLTQWTIGMLRYECSSVNQLAQALLYEGSRIFRDRIVGKEGVSAFDSLLTQRAARILKYSEPLARDVFYLNKAGAGQQVLPGMPVLGRIGIQDLSTLLTQSLQLFEREGFKEMKLHIIEELLELTAREERVLSRRGGNLVLCGRSGVGRKSATQLVAHMLKLEFFSPNLGRHYGTKEFRRDLKNVLSHAGIEGKESILYLEDHHFSDKEFLELINSLIASGEVPDLFTLDELKPQLEDAMRGQFEYRNALQLFMGRIQQNLRVVLSFDYTHPQFMANFASNPALLTRCSILWLEPWRKDSLGRVAALELQDLQQKIGGFDQIVVQMVNLHRQSNTPPGKMLELIHNYRSVFESKLSSQGGHSSHLTAGLSKLADTEKLVDVLQTEAGRQKVEVGKKQQEADEALKQIGAAMEQAASRKQEVEVLQGKLNVEQKEISMRKDKIENQLRHIQPLIDEARKAVGSIRPEHLTEIRGYRMPPQAVHHVLSAVLTLMGNMDTSWASMKKFLANTGVIGTVLNFDAHQITPQRRKQVRDFIQSKSNSFEQSYIKGISGAAAPLAAWVKAILEYSVVLQKINPLEKELFQYEENLHRGHKRLLVCQEQLKELDDRVEMLKKNFAKKTQECQTLRAAHQKAQETLNAAQNLLQKLSGEKSRWQKQVHSLEQELAYLPKNTLVSAAFVTYLGGANQATREQTLLEWLSTLGMKKQFDFPRFMCQESVLLKWKSEGLPSDSLSIENANIILNTVKVPFIIDPATSASVWLRQHLTNATVLTQADPKFNTQLELALRFGKTLIIQEVDSVEPLLMPIVRREFTRQGPRLVVNLGGDKFVDFSETFKLYICTRDAFIDLPPNVQALLTLVNFTVTKSGLEGQLLGKALNFEKPELEKKKTALLKQEDELKMQLAELERSLLTELAMSEGNILENKQLIQRLNETKQKGLTIESGLEQSHNLQQSLDEQREVYRSLARAGSQLFMLISDLVKINNMYQFSLATFVSLFERALRTQTTSSDEEGRMQELIGALRNQTFNAIGRSLFKADRLTFALHFVHSVLPQLFSEGEFEFFKGQGSSGAGDMQPLPKWSTPDRRDKFSLFTSSFPQLTMRLQFNRDDVWGEWAHHKHPEKAFPEFARGQLSLFQRLILVQVFRPDRLESAMNAFACQALGRSNINPPASTLDLLWEETTCREPILFLVTPGSDPSVELEEFASRRIGRQKYKELAMGGGQNELALKMLRETSAKGEWLVLKNLHLVTSWLPSLEKEVKALNPHPDFRLWLTSQPHGKFPSVLAQSSFKITYEAPPGVKKNLERIYQGWGAAFKNTDTLEAQARFTLAWFFSLVQERRTFIPQGWTKFYEFSYGDLRVSETLINETLQEAQQSGGAPKWAIIRNLFEMAVFGGRIDNDFDMRVLQTYLRQFFDQEVFRRNRKLSSLMLVPDTNAIQRHLNQIRELPEQDDPAIFGLPANIDSSVQRFNSNKVIESLKTLQAVSSEELRFDREKWAQLLKPVMKTWSSIYRPEQFGQIQIKPQHLASHDPIIAFTFMEMHNALHTLNVVAETMQGIKDVFFQASGKALLTTKVEDQAKCLLKQEVPDSWTQFWEGPSNTLSWMRQFLVKVSHLRQWIQNASHGSLMKQSLRLSDLLRPGTFLNALRQQTAGEQKCSIDELELVSSFEHGKINSHSCVQLEGLVLQGCAFDGGRLTDTAKGMFVQSDFISLPPLQLAWVPQNSPPLYPSANLASIPLYHSLDRSKLLCKLELPNVGRVEDRIIAGVGIFLTGSE